MVIWNGECVAALAAEIFRTAFMIRTSLNGRFEMLDDPEADVEANQKALLYSICAVIFSVVSTMEAETIHIQQLNIVLAAFYAIPSKFLVLNWPSQVTRQCLEVLYSIMSFPDLKEVAGQLTVFLSAGTPQVESSEIPSVSLNTVSVKMLERSSHELFQIGLRAYRSTSNAAQLESARTAVFEQFLNLSRCHLSPDLCSVLAQSLPVALGPLSASSEWQIFIAASCLDVLHACCDAIRGVLCCTIARSADIRANLLWNEEECNILCSSMCDLIDTLISSDDPVFEVWLPASWKDSISLLKLLPFAAQIGFILKITETLSILAPFTSASSYDAHPVRASLSDVSSSVLRWSSKTVHQFSARLRSTCQVLKYILCI